MNIKKMIMGGVVAGFGLTLLATTAFAVTTYSLVEDAAIVAGGNPGNAAQIRSDAAIAPSYGGVSVVLSAPIPWASLTTLSTDFNVTDDNCGGGSPRVQIRVDTTGDGISDGSVRVALGPSPSFTGCAAGWQSTGNLIGNADAGRYDYSVFGGSPFTTYSNAPAVVTAGQVVGVFVVVDGSWSATATGGDGEQTTLVDNITVNSDVTTFDPVLVGPPTSFGDCNGSGWQTFNNPSFNNRGRCIAYVAQHLGRTSGNVGYTAGFNRHASWGIANTGNTAVSAVGAFVYRDIHHDWYVVKVTSLTHSGDKAWFAGRVTSASQSSWVGNWLFAEVKDNAPDQVWGSFTTQAAAESGVNSMSNPLDGPFNVTSGNLTVH